MFSGLSAIRWGWMALLPALLFALAGIQGCVVKAPKKNYKGPAGRNEAVMILSVTRSGITEFDLVLDLKGEDHEYKNVFTVREHDGLDWKPTNGYRPVPEDQWAGRLVVLLVPPGNYRISAWSGESPFFGEQGNGYGVVSQPISLRFTAPAGHIRYLGNLHFAFPMKLKGYVYNGRYHIRTGDRTPRDLAVFKARYPLLAGQQIETRLIQNAEEGRELQFYILSYHDHESSRP